MPARLPRTNFRTLKRYVLQGYDCGQWLDTRWGFDTLAEAESAWDKKRNELGGAWRVAECDNPKPSAFEVGNTYFCRSVCDHECIWRYTVTSRTDKTVTIQGHGQTVRRKILHYNGVEQIFPDGRYSMAPVLSADRPVED